MIELAELAEDAHLVLGQIDLGAPIQDARQPDGLRASSAGTDRDHPLRIGRA
jgi:hypothetical protein